MARYRARRCEAAREQTAQRAGATSGGSDACGARRSARSKAHGEDGSTGKRAKHAPARRHEAARAVAPSARDERSARLARGAAERERPQAREARDERSARLARGAAERGAAAGARSA